MLTEKQKQYIREANSRWNFKSGAVRSGKSYVDVTAVIPMRIRERISKDGLCFIVGVSKETIERNVLQPMRERYTSAVVGTINSRNIARICGEDVYCLGAEKVSQVAKIQGASAKYVYGDEVAKWHEDVFNMLKSRLDKPYACFDGSLNPEHPTHWLKKFLDSDADIYCQKYTIFDNTFLSPEFVKNLCKEYEGTIYYDRLILGKWVRAEGAIYRRFADDPKKFLLTEKLKQKEISEIVIGVDFGGTKSGHAFVATARINGFQKLVALVSERHFGEYEPGDLDALAIKFARKVAKKYGEVDYVYWDNAESVLGRGLKHAFEQEMPSVIVRPAIKVRVNDRIAATQRLMGSGRFLFTSDCETLKDALISAVWDSKSQDDVRLDDCSSDIDSLDAFEYTFERDMKRFINYEE